MIKNVVFDIGGVLADFRIKEFLAAKRLDAPMIKRILKASVMNPYWGKFERGEVSEEETLQAFCGNRSGDRKGTATCFYKPERDADYPGLRYSASEAIKGCWLRCLLPLQLLKKSL